MKSIIKNAAQIVTVDTKGSNFKRGKESTDLTVLTNHSILIENGIIKDILPNLTADKKKVDKVLDVKDCIILPGLVECHTHSAYSGSRANEFLLRLKGATYEEIAKAGGGIISTMKAVRNSSFEDLARMLKPRIDHFLSQGVTTLEIKSGYGLSFYDEIKLLQVINHFKNSNSVSIIPTFLGAHTFPPEYKNDHKQYLELIIDQLLPYILKNKLAQHIDAFCERSAFSDTEIELIFARAQELGYKIRLHTEQFSNVGGLDIAIKYNALSADHLEVIKDEDISKLANSEMVGVLLPGVSFFLGGPYAPARKLIDENALIALSTDYNPGSSHIPNLQLIMQLAAVQMNMRVEEIISAVTINAAKALGLEKIIGSIEIGKHADFSIFNMKEYSELIYNIGINLNTYTIKQGEIIYSDKN